MRNVAIARLWHRKGKLEYFCIKQLLEYFPDIEFDWHIVLHSPEYTDEWSEKIDKLPISITWYSTTDMLNYLKECDYVNDEIVDKVPNFVHFYHIIIFHYLRRVFRYEYALAYEYDIIFNSYELSELKDCIENKIPFGISEPANPGCDKALYQELSTLFQADILAGNPYANIGVNAGFQGMNLKLFDNFLNTNTFRDLITCFNFSGIYDEKGDEKQGWERTIIDTQEQSFHSLLNRVCSVNYKLLSPKQYYFYPSYLSLEEMYKSKVLHYFGHTKPEEMLNTIETKLKQYEKAETNYSTI
jgi:hypothetical protein